MVRGCPRDGRAERHRRSTAGLALIRLTGVQGCQKYRQSTGAAQGRNHGRDGGRVREDFKEKTMYIRGV